MNVNFMTKSANVMQRNGSKFKASNRQFYKVDYKIHVTTDTIDCIHLNRGLTVMALLFSRNLIIY